RNEYIEFALANSLMLKSLLTDILDMSQVKAGKFLLSLQEFNLYEIIKNVIQLMKITADLKQNKIYLEYDQFLSQTVTSDQYRIRQILINLISNSIKYTKKGNIYIVVTKENEPKHLKIQVKDTGVGIKQEQKQKLFKAFEKIEDNRDLNPQGVGLGLIISNQLAINLFPKNIYSKTGLQCDDWDKGTVFSFLLFDYSNRDSSQQE
ncbi:hypothetical protein IMG5_056390, partial [Ichthyophthirius multifiliis]